MNRLSKTKLIWLAVALVPLLVAVGCGDSPPVSEPPATTPAPAPTMEPSPPIEPPVVSNPIEPETTTVALAGFIFRDVASIPEEIAHLYPESATQLTLLPREYWKGPGECRLVVPECFDAPHYADLFSVITEMIVSDGPPYALHIGDEIVCQNLYGFWRFEYYHQLQLPNKALDCFVFDDERTIFYFRS